MGPHSMEVATLNQSKLQLQCNLQVFSVGRNMQRFGTLSMWKQRPKSVKQCKRDSAKPITKSSVCQNSDKNAKLCTSQYATQSTRRFAVRSTGMRRSTTQRLSATLTTSKTVNTNGKALVTTRFGHQSLELAKIMHMTSARMYRRKN